MLKGKHSYKPQVFTNISSNDKLIKLYNEVMVEEIKTNLEIAKVVLVNFNEQYKEFKALQKKQRYCSS